MLSALAGAGIFAVSVFATENAVIFGGERNMIS